MLEILIDSPQKKNQSALSKGLMSKLTKAVETEKLNSNELAELSNLFDLAFVKKSWSLIPSPEKLPQYLKLSEKALRDPDIEIFNLRIHTSDQSVSNDEFDRAVKKILRMFNELEEKGLVLREDEEENKYNVKTLENLLKYKHSDRFAHRMLRISNMLELKMERDPDNVVTQLREWSIAGIPGEDCRVRSEEETRQYYMAQITNPDQDVDALGRDYWTFELQVALALAKLRGKLVDDIVVPKDHKQRVHQTAHLREKVRYDLSLIGDPEGYHDPNVDQKYRDMSAQEIVEKVLEKYTLDHVVKHVAEETSEPGSLISFEKSVTQKIDRPRSSLASKLEDRLRFQFLRKEFNKTIKRPSHSLDQSLFKDEVSILNGDHCIEKDLSLLMKNASLHSMRLRGRALKAKQSTSKAFPSLPINWETLKKESCREAQKYLEEGFYEEDMSHFSRRGARNP